jgi:hypothetical protein
MVRRYSTNNLHLYLIPPILLQLCRLKKGMRKTRRRRMTRRMKRVVPRRQRIGLQQVRRMRRRRKIAVMERRKDFKFFSMFRLMSLFLRI